MPNYRARLSLCKHPWAHHIVVMQGQLTVYYNGQCPVCIVEVRLYRRLDRDGRIDWVDILTLSEADLPAGKMRDDLLGKFHVRDMHDTESNGSWHIGVDAFARIWQVLPGFRHFAFLFRVPVLRQIAIAAYRVFLRWQQRHRRRREAANAR